MNNKIQILTTGLTNQVVLEDLGNLVLNHPVSEEVQDYIALDRLIGLPSIVRELGLDNITITIGNEVIDSTTDLAHLNLVYLSSNLKRLENLGYLNFIGVWDASTNTPPLVNSTGTKGNYYKVSIAGNTIIDGNDNWTIGDLILFNGTSWDQVQGGTSDVIRGLNYFTEAESTLLSSKRTNSLVPTSADTDVNIALVPKGTGAIVSGVPDGTAVGGNQRGTYAVDLQLFRVSATGVASGIGSFLAGFQSTASGQYSVCLGNANTASAQSSIAIGSLCTSSGLYSLAMGSVCSASSIASVAIGNYSSSTVQNAIAIGTSCVASGVGSLVTGTNANAFSRRNIFAFSSGFESSTGDSQQVRVTYRNRTTDATPTLLTVNSSTAATSDSIYILQNYQGCTAQILVNAILKGSAGVESKAWTFTIRAYRAGSAASTTVTIMQSLSDGTIGAAVWDATIEANTAIGGWQVVVTGVAATNIQWSAAVTAVENIYT